VTFKRQKKKLFESNERRNGWKQRKKLVLRKDPDMETSYYTNWLNRILKISQH